MGLKLIDLSQEIFQGMSIFPMHQRTFIMTNMTHEENMEMTGSPTLGFSLETYLFPNIVVPIAMEYLNLNLETYHR